MKTKRKKKFREDFNNMIRKAVEEKDEDMLNYLWNFTHQCKLAKKCEASVILGIYELLHEREQDKNDNIIR